MIVVDTNIIGYLYISSDRSQQAEQALIKDPHWAAPVLWRSELRNVLALYLRKTHMPGSVARRIMQEAEGLMRGREYEVTSHHVLDLVASSQCSAYDCEFVALARDLDVPLVTVDKLILSHFGDTAVELGRFIAA